MRWNSLPDLEHITTEEMMDWYGSRPLAVQKLLTKYTINKIYRKKDTEKYIIVVGVEEMDSGEHTLRIVVPSSLNNNLTTYAVVGVSQDLIEECDNVPNVDPYTIVEEIRPFLG